MKSLDETAAAPVGAPVEATIDPGTLGAPVQKGGTTGALPMDTTDMTGGASAPVEGTIDEAVDKARGEAKEGEAEIAEVAPKEIDLPLLVRNHDSTALLKLRKVEAFEAKLKDGITDQALLQECEAEPEALVRLLNAYAIELDDRELNDRIDRLVEQHVGSDGFDANATAVALSPIRGALSCVLMAEGKLALRDKLQLAYKLEPVVIAMPSLSEAQVWLSAGSRGADPSPFFHVASLTNLRTRPTFAPQADECWISGTDIKEILTEEHLLDKLCNVVLKEGQLQEGSWRHLALHSLARVFGSRVVRRAEQKLGKPCDSSVARQVFEAMREACKWRHSQLGDADYVDATRGSGCWLLSIATELAGKRIVLGAEELARRTPDLLTPPKFLAMLEGGVARHQALVAGGDAGGDLGCLQAIVSIDGAGSQCAKLLTDPAVLSSPDAVAALEETLKLLPAITTGLVAEMVAESMDSHEQRAAIAKVGLFSCALGNQPAVDALKAIADEASPHSPEGRDAAKRLLSALPAAPIKANGSGWCTWLKETSPIERARQLKAMGMQLRRDVLPMMEEAERLHDGPETAALLRQGRQHRQAAAEAAAKETALATSMAADKARCEEEDRKSNYEQRLAEYHRSPKYLYELKLPFWERVEQSRPRRAAEEGPLRRWGWKGREAQRAAAAAKAAVESARAGNVEHAAEIARGRSAVSAQRRERATLRNRAAAVKGEALETPAAVEAEVGDFIFEESRSPLHTHEQLVEKGLTDSQRRLSMSWQQSMMMPHHYDSHHYDSEKCDALQAAAAALRAAAAAMCADTAAKATRIEALQRELVALQADCDALRPQAELASILDTIITKSVLHDGPREYYLREALYNRDAKQLLTLMKRSTDPLGDERLLQTCAHEGSAIYTLLGMALWDEGSDRTVALLKAILASPAATQAAVDAAASLPYKSALRPILVVMAKQWAVDLKPELKALAEAFPALTDMHELIRKGFMLSNGCQLSELLERDVQAVVPLAHKDDWPLMQLVRVVGEPIVRHLTRLGDDRVKTTRVAEAEGEEDAKEWEAGLIVQLPSRTLESAYAAMLKGSVLRLQQTRDSRCLEAVLGFAPEFKITSVVEHPEVLKRIQEATDPGKRAIQLLRNWSTNPQVELLSGLVEMLQLIKGVIFPSAHPHLLTIQGPTPQAVRAHNYHARRLRPVIDFLNSITEPEAIHGAAQLAYNPSPESHAATVQQASLNLLTCLATPGGNGWPNVAIGKPVCDLLTTATNSGVVSTVAGILCAGKEAERQGYEPDPALQGFCGALMATDRFGKDGNEMQARLYEACMKQPGFEMEVHDNSSASQGPAHTLLEEARRKLAASSVAATMLESSFTQREQKADAATVLDLSLALALQGDDSAKCVALAHHLSELKGSLERFQPPPNEKPLVGQRRGERIARLEKGIRFLSRPSDAFLNELRKATNALRAPQRARQLLFDAALSGPSNAPGSSALPPPPVYQALLPPAAPPAPLPLALPPPPQAVAQPALTLDQQIAHLDQQRNRYGCPKCEVALTNPAAREAFTEQGGKGRKRNVGDIQACPLLAHGKSKRQLVELLNVHWGSTGPWASLGPQAKRQKIEAYMQTKHGVTPLGKSTGARPYTVPLYAYANGDYTPVDPQGNACTGDKSKHTDFYQGFG